VKVSQHGRVTLYDFEPTLDLVSEEVLGGLLRPAKVLPAKLLYDKRGSQLFEEITTLDEYYPTRTEIGILSRYAPEIAGLIGPSGRLIEPGSGSSTKTRLLLDQLVEPTAYVPIDIARVQLLEAASALAADYSRLAVLAVCADYTRDFDLPAPPNAEACTVTFFPGSTIGNFEPEEAASFLKRIAGWCGRGGGLLIGVDLKKDPAILEPAYNDHLGVTAAFNLNLLERINHELGADFVLEGFRHVAVYNEKRGRIEMRLVSLQPQTVHILGHEIGFEAREAIVTEHSYKYSIEEFERLAFGAGLTIAQAWTDDRRLFGVLYCKVAS
jgi:dimethylhistidine N-methyltransferase